MALTNLSPRQKMINMMYLILIAMLALNVSREILKTFYLMEVSFESSKKSLTSKNTLLALSLADFEKSNKQRANKWYEKAKSAQKISSEFSVYIQSIRKALENTGGGRSLPEISSVAYSLTELNKPDNMEPHANYFINQKKGYDLQQKINNTRESLLQLLNDQSINKNALIIKQLREQSTLKAEDSKNSEGKKMEWVRSYLEQAPLAGVMALLSKIETDCKNLESEVLTVLYNQVEAKTFKVDTLNATVLPESPFVLIGEEYKARIAVTALNTTSSPSVVINGAKVPVENGYGVYSQKAVKQGVNTIEGYVEVPGPNGEMSKLKVASQWISFAPTATISPEAFNLLYIGIDNPLSVSIPGFSPDDVIVSVSNGAGVLRKVGSGKYSLKPNAVVGNKTTISASVKMPDGKIKVMGTMEFRLRNVPTPTARLGTWKSSAPISVGVLRAQSSLVAFMGDDWAFNNVSYTVVSYKAMLYNSRGQVVGPFSFTSSSLDGVKSKFNFKSGDNLMVYDIIAQSNLLGKKQLQSLFVQIQ